VTFDESNGSQVEHVDKLCVGKDIPVEKAIKKMVIGEVKPQEDDEHCKIIEELPSATLAVNPGESRENPENPEISETLEKTSKTLDLLLVTLKEVKKMRI
jgi:hypothetical protein